MHELFAICNLKSIFDWYRFMRKKPKPRHCLAIPTLRNGIDSFHLVTLPDGRCGKMWVKGWLDDEGYFYEVPEGGIAKVQDVEGCWLVYVPIHLLKINSFAIGIVWK